MLFTLVSYLELGPEFWLVAPLAMMAYFAFSGGHRRSAICCFAFAGLALIVALPAAKVAGERLV